MNDDKIKQFNEFKETLKTKTKEELENLEKTIIEEADNLDKNVSNAKLKLKKEGFKEAAEGIQYFLNMQKVQWNYTQGLITLYEFWDDYKPEITFPMLDTTLRTLGQLQFTGIDEWKKVVAINDYFKDISEEYKNLSESIFDVANRHNAVMDALDLVTPVKEVEVQK